jgi:hypothetical protein
MTRPSISDEDLSALGAAWPLVRLVEFFKDDADRDEIDEMPEETIARAIERVRQLEPVVAARTDPYLDPSTMPDVRDLGSLRGIVVARGLLRAGQRFWQRLSPDEQAQALAGMPSRGLAPTVGSVLRGLVGGYSGGVIASLSMALGETPEIEDLFPYAVPLAAFEAALDEAIQAYDANPRTFKKALGIRGRRWFRR